MTDQFPPPPPPDPASAPPPPPAFNQPPAGYGQPPLPQAPPPPYEGAYVAPLQYGAPIGKVRSTGVCILLAIVTLGIYTWFWYYQTSEEMKRHSGQGLGGLVSLLLAIFVGFLNPFFTSSEVGNLYERSGRPKPVSGVTGVWAVPFGIFIIPAIVWFVKTNGALNDYWKSVGAQG